MDVKAMSENITPYGAKPCIKWGEIVDLYVRLTDGSPRCLVSVDGMDDHIDAGFYYTCQHWIYNRNLPASKGEEAGYSAFCIGDQVIVYLGPVDNVAVGVYDDTFSGVVTHQPCWPLFDPSISFAVAVVAASATLYSWGAPFLGQSGLPFDFVTPMTDAFLETRPLGTYQSVASASGRHIRLITVHTVGIEEQYVAHTLHEAFRVLPTGVFLCPATTENGKYFLGRKIGYNSPAARVIVDDISIVRGVIDNGTLRGLSFFKDERKIYIGTFSKVLDRIQTIWDNSDYEPFVEVKVGYFEFGRVDHLWCIKHLIANCGEQHIIDLPGFSQGQTPSITMMRNVWCVPNIGVDFSVNPAGMRMIFLGFGTASDLGITPTKSYHALATYDQSSIDLGNVQLSVLSPYSYEPNSTGGALDVVRSGGTPQSSSPDYYNWDMQISPQVFSGPDYPSVISGDNTFTVGLYGTSSGGDFNEDYTWAYLGAPHYRWYKTDRSVAVSFNANTYLSFKHNGEEITRATSIVSSVYSQNVTFNQDNDVTGCATDYASSITYSEVHWFVVRPDLGLYVFSEVQVFDDHEPYTEYPPAAITAHYYVWFNGVKTLLSSSATSFPSPPTLSQYMAYEHMVGRYHFTPEAYSYFSVHAGTIDQITGGTYNLDIMPPYLPDEYQAGYFNSLSIGIPRCYVLLGRIWRANSNYQSLTNVPIHEAQRNAGGALMLHDFAFSPIRKDDNTDWIAPLNIYNFNQVEDQYTDHWSWLAESNEINQMTFGISDDEYSDPRVFTCQRMYFKYGVSLGQPMFFGGHIYVIIPDVFTTGRVHEFFSGPIDMLGKIKQAVHPTGDVVFATTVS